MLALTFVLCILVAVLGFFLAYKAEEYTRASEQIGLWGSIRVRDRYAKLADHYETGASWALVIGLFGSAGHIVWWVMRGLASLLF